MQMARIETYKRQLNKETEYTLHIQMTFCNFSRNATQNTEST